MNGIWLVRTVNEERSLRTAVCSSVHVLHTHTFFLLVLSHLLCMRATFLTPCAYVTSESDCYTSISGIGGRMKGQRVVMALDLRIHVMRDVMCLLLISASSIRLGSALPSDWWLFPSSSSSSSHSRSASLSSADRQQQSPAEADNSIPVTHSPQQPSSLTTPSVLSIATEDFEAAFQGECVSDCYGV